MAPVTDSTIVNGLRALLASLPPDAPPWERRMAADVEGLADRFRTMRTAETLLRDATSVREVADRLSYCKTVVNRWRDEGYLDPAAFPAARRPRRALGLLVAMRCRGCQPVELEVHLGKPWPWLRATRYRLTRPSLLEQIAEALDVTISVVTGDDPPGLELAHPVGVEVHPHELTAPRMKALAFIGRRSEDSGVEGLPTVPEVATHLGRTPGTARHHMVKLLEAGYLATRGRGWLDQYLLSRQGLEIVQFLKRSGVPGGREA